MIQICSHTDRASATRCVAEAYAGCSTGNDPCWCDYASQHTVTCGPVCVHPKSLQYIKLCLTPGRGWCVTQLPTKDCIANVHNQHALPHTSGLHQVSMDRREIHIYIPLTLPHVRCCCRHVGEGIECEQALSCCDSSSRPQHMR